MLVYQRVTKYCILWNGSSKLNQIWWYNAGHLRNPWKREDPNAAMSLIPSLDLSVQWLYRPWNGSNRCHTFCSVWKPVICGVDSLWFTACLQADLCVIYVVVSNLSPSIAQWIVTYCKPVSIHALGESKDWLLDLCCKDVSLVEYQQHIGRELCNFTPANKTSMWKMKCNMQQAGYIKTTTLPRHWNDG
jgi:hypothetical protein